LSLPTRVMNIVGIKALMAVDRIVSHCVCCASQQKQIRRR